MTTLHEEKTSLSLQEQKQKHNEQQQQQQQQQEDEENYDQHYHDNDHETLPNTSEYVENENDNINDDINNNEYNYINNFILFSICFSINHSCGLACMTLATSQFGNVIGSIQDSLLYLSYTISVFLAPYIIKQYHSKYTIIYGMYLFCFYIIFGCYIYLIIINYYNQTIYQYYDYNNNNETNNDDIILYNSTNQSSYSWDSNNDDNYLDNETMIMIMTNNITSTTNYNNFDNYNNQTMIMNHNNNTNTIILYFIHSIALIGAIFGGLGAGICWTGQGVYFAEACRTIHLVRNRNNKNDNNTTNDNYNNYTYITNHFSMIFAVCVLILETCMDGISTLLIHIYHIHWTYIFLLYSILSIVSTLILHYYMIDYHTHNHDNTITPHRHRNNSNNNNLNHHSHLHTHHDSLTSSKMSNESEQLCHHRNQNNNSDNNKNLKYESNDDDDATAIDSNITATTIVQKSRSNHANTCCRYICCLKQKNDDNADAILKRHHHNNKNDHNHLFFSSIHILIYDSRMKYFIFYHICFGLTGAFLNSYISGEVVYIVMKHDISYIGIFVAIHGIVAALSSILYSYAISYQYMTKNHVHIIGCISFGLVGLLYLLYPNIHNDWNVSMIIFIYCIQGIGRSTFEGNLKSLFADYFTSTSTSSTSDHHRDLHHRDLYNGDDDDHCDLIHCRNGRSISNNECSRSSSDDDGSGGNRLTPNDSGANVDHKYHGNDQRNISRTCSGGGGGDSSGDGEIGSCRGSGGKCTNDDFVHPVKFLHTDNNVVDDDQNHHTTNPSDNNGANAFFQEHTSDHTHHHKQIEEMDQHDYDNIKDTTNSDITSLDSSHNHNHNKEGAFANIILQYGFASSVGYIFTSYRLSCNPPNDDDNSNSNIYCTQYRDGTYHNMGLFALWIVISSIIAILGFLRASYLHRQQQDEQQHRQRIHHSNSTIQTRTTKMMMTMIAGKRKDSIKYDLLHDNKDHHHQHEVEDDVEELGNYDDGIQPIT